MRFSSSISNIALGQFSASDGGMLDMLSATSGTEITLRSTHTADGSITLRYTGTSAAMQTSTAVALTLPPPQRNDLVDLPTTATATTASRGTTNRMVSVSGTTVTLAGTSYDFTNTKLANGRVISENNDLLIFKQEIDSLGGFHMLLSGTTDVDRVDFIYIIALTNPWVIAGT